jgi:hypothetical protein
MPRLACTSLQCVGCFDDVGFAEVSDQHNTSEDDRAAGRPHVLVIVASR